MSNHVWAHGAAGLFAYLFIVEREASWVSYKAASGQHPAGQMS